MLQNLGLDFVYEPVVLLVQGFLDLAFYEVFLLLLLLFAYVLGIALLIEIWGKSSDWVEFSVFLDFVEMEGDGPFEPASFKLDEYSD